MDKTVAKVKCYGIYTGWLNKERQEDLVIKQKDSEKRNLDFVEVQA